MNNNILIGNKKIGSNEKPFIIAEMSGNHNQSLDRAIEIVEAAAESGVHALKLQTYTADTITLNVKNKEFFLMMKKVFGRGDHSINFTKRLIHHGNGISQS